MSLVANNEDGVGIIDDGTGAAGRSVLGNTNGDVVRLSQWASEAVLLRFNSSDKLVEHVSKHASLSGFKINMSREFDKENKVD
jgi:hypothetical protein